jgi:hypothetical protein
MESSGLRRCVLAFGAALGGIACSATDFGYLSAEFGASGAGGSAGAVAHGGAVAQAGGGGAEAAGTGTGGGLPPQAGGASGSGGSEAIGASGSAGSDAIDEWFCDPQYAVHGEAAAGAPPDALPVDGDYILHKQDSVADCLITPDWPELGDKRYFAITSECGGPGSPSPPRPGEVWHLEHLCSDVYRFTSHHGTADARQLGIVDQTEVGTPVYSVPGTDSLNPYLLFHLRFEEQIGDRVRWRFSPAILAVSCLEEIGTARYGEVDVTPVVHYPCTGNLGNQSWNLLPVP